MATESTDTTVQPATPLQPTTKRRIRPADIGWYLVLTALSLIILFPIYMLILRALSNPLEYVKQGQPLHPVDIEWDVFVKAFTEADLGRAMTLSLLVTVIIVAVQLITSVLAAYAFAFLGAWNQYVWPRFATDQRTWQTVQVALRSIGSDRVDRLNIGFAAAILAALPLLALLIFFQRQMIRGLTAGAVKG
jgi:ABC-type glycerol-3-phosphate transport system permease component